MIFETICEFRNGMLFSELCVACRWILGLAAARASAAGSVSRQGATIMVERFGSSFLSPVFSPCSYNCS